MEQPTPKSPQLNPDILSFKVKELAFEALFKNLPVAFYWMDKDGYFMGCNDVELKIHGLSSLSEFIGKHSNDISHPSAWLNSKAAMETNQTSIMEEVHHPPNGKKIYYLSIKSPIQDADGNAIGLLGIAIDISERKKMEQELRIAKEKAEAADHAKTQFLAVASHELRIPLTGILGLVGFLKQGNLQPSEVENYLNHIDSCSSHLLSIVNDVLDFAKLEAAQFQLAPVPIDLKSLVEEVATMLKVSAKNKGLDLLLEFDSKIPADILADSRALRQILVNLVNNSIKFTEKGHVKIKTHCIQQREDRVQVEITVQDTGRGMPADKLEMIFEKFTQVEDAYTRDSSKKGTGLGLAIVKKLVGLMEGNIVVDSTVGVGSSFKFIAEFPVQTEDSNALEWLPYASKVRILIVDDSPLTTDLCKMLGTVNCDVVSSEEALNELVSAHQLGRPYQVVIIDQSIKPQKPTDLLKKMHHQKNLTPLLSLLLTTDDSQPKNKQVLPEGFFATLSKISATNAFQTALTSIWEKWQRLLQKNKPKNNLPRKVLLVEDDKIVQLVHTRMLMEFNCEVDHAETGHEALRLCQKKSYDVVFVDVGLPDITGYEVIRRLREDPKDRINKIPLIALTGYTGDEEKQSCLAAGASEVASKPIAPEALEKLLEKYIH